jgi:hypothetical protein
LDPVVVRNYRGRNENVILARFEEDARAMTELGYVVVSQDWGEGLPDDMFRTFLFGFRGPLPRVLTVTYQLP